MTYLTIGSPVFGPDAMKGEPATKLNVARAAVEQESLAGRAITVLEDLQKQGRMSRAEAQIVLDLIWHPAFPNFLRDRASAPIVSELYGEARAVS